MFLSHEAVKQRRGEMKRASAVGMVLVLGLLFGGSFMAASQAEGEGDRGELTREEIIQRATEYLEGAATYSVDVSVLIKMDFGIFKHEMEAEYRIAVERPNKFAIVPSGAMEMVFGARVCDGERLYNHQPMMKRYTVEEAPEKTGADLVSTSLAAGPMGLFISGFFTEMDELEMVQPAEEGGCEFEYVGIEEIDGVKCHRVRRRYAEAPLEGVECEMWIDAGEKPLPRRMSQDLSGMYSRVMQDVDDKDIPDVFGKGQFKEMFKDAEYVIAARFENWKVNARLPEDTFKFTPPEGAKRDETSLRESFAESVLAKVAAAEKQFAAAVDVDQDGDGVGEYGSLQELLGAVALRGSSRKAEPAYLPRSLAEKMVGGAAQRRGYNFKIYLPGDGGEILSEVDGKPLAMVKEDGVDLQEKHFVCYAWPEEAGTTGTKAFATSDERLLWETDMEKVVYEGTKSIPAPSAAYRGKVFTSALGGSDGNVWATMNWWERAKEAKELGSSRGPSAVEKLTGLLKDREDSVRVEAAKSLGKIGDESAAGALAEALKDKDWRVRDEAAKALEKLGWAPDSSEDVIAYLIAKDEWDDVAEMGPEAADALWALLEDENDLQRSRAALALAKMGDERAVEPLIKGLKEGWFLMRSEAVRALGEVGDERAVEPLMEMVREGDELLRSTAAEALGKIGDERAVEPLVNALKDDEWWVRYAAAEALDKLGWEPESKEESVAYFVAAKKVEKLGELGEEAMEPLLAFLTGEDEMARGNAAKALGKFGDKRAVEPLIAALNDKEEWVRVAAAEALGKLGDERAVEPLIEGLKDKEEWVRAKSAEGLGLIGDKRGVEPLMKVLGDREKQVRGYAAQALGEIGDERAVEPLIDALKDEKREVRRDAMRALGKIGDERAVEPLIATLSHEMDDTRHGAVYALADLGDLRAVEPLIALLKDESARVRRSTAGALGSLGDERAVQALLGALKDENWEVRTCAAQALGKIGDERAIEPLKAATEDENDEVREAAAKALERIGQVIGAEED